MQKQDIENSVKRLKNKKADQVLSILLDNGISMHFTEIDFDVGDGSTCVWLYENRLAMACIDTRSIVGVRLAR